MKIELSHEESRALLTDGRTGRALGLKELREARGERAEMIRSLADVFETAGRWADVETETRFFRADAELKAIDAAIATEQGKLNAIGDKLERGELRLSGDRCLGDRGNAGPSPILFRDSNGKMVRAFRHGERIADTERQTPGMRLDDSEPFMFGRMLVSRLLNDPAILSPAEQRLVMNGLDGSGGIMLSPSIGANVLDSARASLVCSRLGMPTLPMPTETHKLLRIASDPTPVFRHEGVAITASDPTFDAVVLTAKTMAVLVPISIEKIEDSPNAAQVVEMAITGAMAAKLDAAIMTGTGAAAEPLGIINTTGVNAIAVNATPTSYAKYSEAIGDILAANYPGELERLGWVSNPADAEVLDNLKEGTTNAPLSPTPWCAKPQRAMTTGLTAGYSIIGDFSQVVLGMRTRGMTVEVLNAGTVVDGSSITRNAASEMLRFIRVYMRVDVAVMRPTWFSVLSGLTTT